ncbi:MAG: acyl carrier protein [Bacteroidales bacterium]|nr:acyl carrier protein [Saprospiraceae bacterium]MCF8381579.1 acyl carrier protein [Bacteroidales bacterium]
MELNEILSDLNSLYQRVLENEKVVLEFETTANDVDGWDSLNHMILITEIEKQFKIKFALKEIMRLKNIGDVCFLIKNKLV